MSGFPPAEKNQHREAVLRYLYERKSNAPGQTVASSRLEAVASGTGLPMTAVRQAEDYLFAEGLIQRLAMGPIIGLTHAGEKRVEALLAVPITGRALVVLVFTDIAESTRLAADLGDAEWARVARRHDEIARSCFHTFGGREIDHAGDGFLIEFPALTDAINCGLNLIEAVAHEKRLKVRVGVHVGEVQRDGPRIVGSAVNFGKRIEAEATPNAVWVSRPVRDIAVGSGIFTFVDQGERHLKGFAQPHRLFSVSRGDVG